MSFIKIIYIYTLGFIMAIRTKITTGGKISIPSIYRKQLGLKDGDEVLMDIQEGQIVISSLRTSLLKARHLISKYHSQDESLAGNLTSSQKEENNE
ncbi:MAG: AbrB/MazE/SpoVT family DNA-binding domain-containing protein [Candidatus Paracaedibacteraceae bacterium]|nr:AbrB/MazE/SpoVT family DNA-binding domain-containing protein [Candidatus Paracaedibacteraceae bacterium]